jgi:catechol 2,3-dioxygenase-like lactoylglutathione lyase family enzyme
VFDHVTVRAPDREASERFYARVLAALGVDRSHEDEWYVEWSDFSVAQATAEQPAARRLHVGFAAPDRETVDGFHAALVAAGYRDNGVPGERPVYHAGDYGAFVVDPDGTNVELVFHDRRGIV